ncbi:MAG TPA: glycosyltransferase family 2 protein [Candidatus Nanoarchaeia archaeon]|nr:glycosyltransferase family 2 protein [Candidatus Nanoarchaeia archaeon]
MGKSISVVVPVFNEAENIPVLYRSLKEVLIRLGFRHEIIFVDDGSTDNTPKTIENISSKDRTVKHIRFRRNLQKAAALSAGFREAKGDIVFTMDGDMQDDPREIPRFLAKMDEGYDLVVGWKYRRKDPLTKTIPSKFFNFLTRLVTGVKVHDSNCGFKAFRSEAVKNLKVYGELHRFIPSLAYLQGFRVGEIKVEHHKRLHGKSKYGISRLFKGFFDLLTVQFLMKYGKRPMHFFGGIGMLCILAGLLIGIYLVALWLNGIKIGSRPLLILGVLLVIVGAQFFSMGYLGEMVARLGEEKK